MAELAALETKTITNTGVKAPTLEAEKMEKLTTKTFKNVVSNQRDVTIDLSQFLDAEELGKLATKNPVQMSSPAQADAAVEVLDGLSQNQQPMQQVVQPNQAPQMANGQPAVPEMAPQPAMQQVPTQNVMAASTPQAPTMPM